MRLAGTIALAALLCTCAGAEIERFDPPDPRLDQKVTLEANHAKLEDVVKDLSDQSGVVIKAGSGKRDWRAKERRVTVHAKDAPLGTVMDQLSALLQFRISRGGEDGEWTYLYWQDAKRRALEEEMRTAEKEAAARRSAKLRSGALDFAAEALEMSPEDALKKRSESPLAAYLGGTTSGRGWAQMLSSLGAYFPIEHDLMLRGQRVTIGLTDLPPELEQAAADVAAGGLAGAVKKLAQGRLDDVVPHQLIIMPIGESDDQAAGLLGIGGVMYMIGRKPDGEQQIKGGLFGGGIPIGVCPLCSADSPLGDAFGKVLFLIEDGVDLMEANKQVQGEVINAEFMAKALARESKTEEDPPTDPELTREVELDEIPAGFRTPQSLMDTTETVSKAVVEISKAVGEPVLLESFKGLMPLGGYVKAGKQPYYNILIGLEKAGYAWAREDGVLRIRPEDWATRRSYEIPESFMAHYKELLKEQGELTLDDLAAVATSLTDAQIKNTLVTDKDLQLAAIGLVGGAGGGLDMLRLYGSFSTQAKAALAEEPGLPFAALTAEQWELLSGLTTNQLGGVYVLDGTIRLEPLAEQQQRARMLSRTFQFTVYVAGETEPRSFAETVMIFGKKQIEQMKAMQKKAQEEAEKAAKEKEQGKRAPNQSPAQ